MFWLAFATASPPAQHPSPYRAAQARGLQGLFQANDYPAEAVRNNQQGSVIARLVINPAGGVESCSVIYSSKSEALDRATCHILQARTRLSPARDERDSPIYTVVITPPITWLLMNGPGVNVRYGIVPKPDVELQISQAPSGISLPTEFSVDYEVKSDGKIGWCRSSADSKVPTVLVEVACNQTNMPAFQALQNRAGRPVDAVYSAKYRFVFGKP
ncbi:MAG: energy transducer TonB [Sphingomicrobium sp.]